uniref:Uncharacterized protein n=1 Tax=Anguilla anguilla TaxID=7936 RepID=A0A0E9PL55_ANGAN
MQVVGRAFIDGCYEPFLKAFVLHGLTYFAYSDLHGT